VSRIPTARYEVADARIPMHYLCLGRIGLFDKSALSLLFAQRQQNYERVENRQ
jgi:hypothetical protein